jgi:hypothetical protein
VVNHSHAGCAWIVDQLIAIREMEQKLVAALEAGDQKGKMRLHFRLAELNRWLDKLDQALEGYGSPNRLDRLNLKALMRDLVGPDGFGPTANGL